MTSSTYFIPIQRNYNNHTIYTIYTNPMNSRKNTINSVPTANIGCDLAVVCLAWKKGTADSLLSFPQTT